MDGAFGGQVAVVALVIASRTESYVNGCCYSCCSRGLSGRKLSSRVSDLRLRKSVARLPTSSNASRMFSTDAATELGHFSAV